MRTANTIRRRPPICVTMESSPNASAVRYTALRATPSPNRPSPPAAVTRWLNPTCVTSTNADAIVPRISSCRPSEAAVSGADRQTRMASVRRTASSQNPASRKAPHAGSTQISTNSMASQPTDAAAMRAQRPRSRPASSTPQTAAIANARAAAIPTPACPILIRSGMNAAARRAIATAATAQNRGPQRPRAFVDAGVLLA